MDKLDFAADVIRSLAWPTAVIGGIIIFRKKISSLLDRLRSFVLFGLRGTFAEEMEKVSKTTISGAKPSIETPLTSDLPNEDVIAAFEEIEGTLEDIRPLVDKNLPTYRSVVERLERDGHIKTEALQLFNSLREVRNIAQTAGSEQISTPDAQEYQRKATLLNDVFKDASTRLQDRHETSPLK